MKKKVALLGVATFASSILLGGGTALAAHETEYPATPAATETPVSATFKLADNGGETPKPPVDPTDPDNGENEQNQNVGAFGIAYQPKAFKIAETVLKESGEQIVEVTKKANQTFNVGVKDRTRETKGWSLNAKLVWDGASIAGAEMTTTTDGRVFVNKNNGTDEFQSSELIELPGNEASSVANYVITNQESPILIGTDGVQHTEVYDVDLGTVSLKIPEVSKVKAGGYTGKVQWNLTLAP